VDLFPRSCTTQGFDVSNAAQAKEKSYHNGHPTDQFCPLTIEVFGCLYKHADVFLHDYANTIWSPKGIESLHLSTLVTFLCQIFLIIIQRIQASSILSQVVAIGLTIS